MPAGRRTDGLAAAVVAAVALMGFQAWWWYAHKRGYPHFVDEGGYIDFGIAHANALREGGLHGLWTSYRRQPVYAPLVPLVLGVGILLFHHPEGLAAGLVILSSGALVVMTYVLARELVGRNLALLAAVVIGLSPDALVWGRVFIFAVPAAVIFTVGLWCYIRWLDSDRWPWALAGGLSLGLALLARTLMIGFVVGPLVAASVAILVQPGHRARTRVVRLGVLAGSAAVAVLVAATWYVGNYGAARTHLSGVGARRATDHFFPGLREVSQLFVALQLPLALVLTAVLVGGSVVWLRSRRGAPHAPVAAAAGAWLATPTAFLALVFAEGFVLLHQAPDATGQWVAVLPALGALVVRALDKVPRQAQAVAAVALAAITAVNLLAFSGEVGYLGRPRTFAAGALGQLTLTDGRWFLEQTMAGRGLDADGHLPSNLRHYDSTYVAIITAIRDQAAAHGQFPMLYLRDDGSRLMNINNLALADNQLHGRATVGINYLPRTDSSRTAIAEAVDNPRSPKGTFALLVDPYLIGDPPGYGRWDASLGAAGFQVLRVFPTPEGRHAVLYWRPPPAS